MFIIRLVKLHINCLVNSKIQNSVYISLNSIHFYIVIHVFTTNCVDVDERT